MTFAPGGKERKYAAALKERGGSADKRGEEDAAGGMRKAPTNAPRRWFAGMRRKEEEEEGQKDTHTAAKGSVNIPPLLPEAEIGEGNGEKESSLQLLPFSSSSSE